MARQTTITGMGQAKATSKPSKVTRDGIGSARKALEGFGTGLRVCGLTGGQFSLIDLLDAVLDITGPADVAISTWTAGVNDTEAAKRAESMGRITRLRMLVDRSFLNRQPKYASRLVDLYGPESIRTCRIHAKFVVVTNDDWNVLISTSMNLNMNRRIESYDVSESPEIVAVWLGLINEIWETAKPGLSDKLSKTRDYIAERLGGESGPCRDDAEEIDGIDLDAIIWGND